MIAAVAASVRTGAAGARAWLDSNGIEWCVNNQVHSTDHAMVDVLPRDITTLPHVLGSDLIEYLATASMGTPGRRDLWDPFTEAADVIDPGLWYTTSFDATPERSVTRWLPPDGSGLATVAVYSQGGPRRPY
jgi:hypothetical protein